MTCQTTFIGARRITLIIHCSIYYMFFVTELKKNSFHVLKQIFKAFAPGIQLAKANVIDGSYYLMFTTCKCGVAMRLVAFVCLYACPVSVLAVTFECLHQRTSFLTCRYFRTEQGRWVMGHGSNGSRKSDGSHGSWVTRC